MDQEKKTWPKDRDVYGNVLKWLVEINMEICSPSELRHEFFSQKKSKLSSNSSLRLDPQTFKSFSTTEESRNALFHCTNQTSIREIGKEHLPQISLNLSLTSSLFEKRKQFSIRSCHDSEKEKNNIKNKLDTSINEEGQEEEATKAVCFGSSLDSLDSELKTENDSPQL